MHDARLYRLIVDFIAGLGLPVTEVALADETFLPGIAIRDGGLLVDPDRLLWPGDLLHEAGHLAVLPPGLRAQAQDDLTVLEQQSILDASDHPLDLADLEHSDQEHSDQLRSHQEQPHQQHVDEPHAGEQEALAWAWAAAMHLGIPPEALIHDGGYLGKSRELLQMYAVGIYPGLRGLCETGMTSAPGFASPQFSTSRQDSAEIAGDGTPPIRYPGMHRWLRE